MESYAILFIIIPILAIHYAYAEIRMKKNVPYSINAFLLKALQEKLDNAANKKKFLLTTKEIRDLLTDAKIASKSEKSADDLLEPTKEEKISSDTDTEA